MYAEFQTTLHTLWGDPLIPRGMLEARGSYSHTFYQTKQAVVACLLGRHKMLKIESGAFDVSSGSNAVDSGAFYLQGKV